MKIMSKIEQLVINARLAAACGVFDGTMLTKPYLDSCTHLYPLMHASIIFTRDVGYHSGGWWKNPDYERCFHLSVSFADGFTRSRGNILAKAFFGHDVKLLWVEPPCTKQGKHVGVYHYRLFCDEGWNPIKPSGEVYSPKMPIGWKSFSELHT